jgi:hypothetical protein
MRNVYTIFVGRPEGKIFFVVYFKKIARISEYRL